MARLTNAELRNSMQNLGVKQWQIAEELGITEQRLSTMFRHELTAGDAAAVKIAMLKVARRAEAAKAETPEARSAIVGAEVAINPYM